MAATHRTVTIVGAPLDLGQGRRGVDMGPSAIRYAGLEERLSSFGCVVVDRGNVAAPEPEALAVEDERARFLPEILEACAGLANSLEVVEVNPILDRENETAALAVELVASALGATIL